MVKALASQHKCGPGSIPRLSVICGLSLGGAGVLPYMGYILGMCCAKGYGFSAALVINRVSILAILVINRVSIFAL